MLTTGVEYKLETNNFTRIFDKSPLLVIDTDTVVLWMWSLKYKFAKLQLIHNQIVLQNIASDRKFHHLLARDATKSNKTPHALQITTNANPNHLSKLHSAMPMPMPGSIK